MLFRPEAAGLCPLLRPIASLAYPRLSVQYCNYRNDGVRRAVLFKEPRKASRLNLGCPCVIADIKPEPCRVPEVIASIPGICRVKIDPGVRQAAPEHGIARAWVSMAHN
jgi:hypothetical protein